MLLFHLCLNTQKLLMGEAGEQEKPLANLSVAQKDSVNKKQMKGKKDGHIGNG